MTSGAISEKFVLQAAGGQGLVSPQAPRLPEAQQPGEISQSFLPTQRKLASGFQNSLETPQQGGDSQVLSQVAQGVQQNQNGGIHLLSPAVSVIILHTYAPELEGFANPDDFSKFMAENHWPKFLTDGQKMKFLATQDTTFRQLVDSRPDLSYNQALLLLVNSRHEFGLPLEVMMKRKDISFGDLTSLMNTIAGIVEPINPALVSEVQAQACSLLVSTGMGPSELSQIYLTIADNPATMDPGQMLAAFSRVANGSITTPAQAEAFLNPPQTQQPQPKINSTSAQTDSSRNDNGKNAGGMTTVSAALTSSTPASVPAASAAPAAPAAPASPSKA